MVTWCTWRRSGEWRVAFQARREVAAGAGHRCGPPTRALHLAGQSGTQPRAEARTEARTGPEAGTEGRPPGWSDSEAPDLPIPWWGLSGFGGGDSEARPPGFVFLWVPVQQTVQRFQARTAADITPGCWFIGMGHSSKASWSGPDQRA